MENLKETLQQVTDYLFNFDDLIVIIVGLGSFTVIFLLILLKLSFKSMNDIDENKLKQFHQQNQKSN